MSCAGSRGNGASARQPEAIDETKAKRHGGPTHPMGGDGPRGNAIIADGPSSFTDAPSLALCSTIRRSRTVPEVRHATHAARAGVQPDRDGSALAARSRGGTRLSYPRRGRTRRVLSCCAHRALPDPRDRGAVRGDRRVDDPARTASQRPRNVLAIDRRRELAPVVARKVAVRPERLENRQHRPACRFVAIRAIGIDDRQQLVAARACSRRCAASAFA